MIEYQTIVYRNVPCVRLANDEVELIVAVGMGPRILVYRQIGGVNFFKNFDKDFAEFPSPRWRSMGGHRLCHAPEIYPRTYYVDADQVKHTFVNGALKLECATEPESRLQKEIWIELAEHGSKVKLRHKIYNRHNWPVELASWGVTVMAERGRAVIPLLPMHGRSPAEPYRQARTLILWPFTRMNDPRFVWGDYFIQIIEDSQTACGQKIGLANKAGWAAYALNDRLLVKRFPFDPALRYPEGNCNSEFFTTAGMLEIEVLGPLSVVSPGGYAEHTEEWEIHNITLANDEPEMIRQLQALQLLV